MNLQRQQRCLRSFTLHWFMPELLYRRLSKHCVRINRNNVVPCIIIYVQQRYMWKRKHDRQTFLQSESQVPEYILHLKGALSKWNLYYFSKKNLKEMTGFRKERNYMEKCDPISRKFMKRRETARKGEGNLTAKFNPNVDPELHHNRIAWQGIDTENDIRFLFAPLWTKSEIPLPENFMKLKVAFMFQYLLGLILFCQSIATSYRVSIKSFITSGALSEILKK